MFTSYDLWIVKVTKIQVDVHYDNLGREIEFVDMVAILLNAELVDTLLIYDESQQNAQLFHYTLGGTGTVFRVYEDKRI